MSHDLELELWREVGQHQGLSDLLTRIHPLLADALGVQAITVRRVDEARHLCESLAAVGPAALSVEASTPIRTGDAMPLRRFISGAQASPLRAAPEAVRRLGPSSEQRGCVVAPLTVQEGAFLVYFSAAPDRTLDLAALSSTLPALQAALKHEAQLTELARLQEALEADKRALLARLGREDIAETLVGAESGLAEVVRRMEQVAPIDTPVLLLGETGTGKEVVARLLHRRSPRATGPMVAINCGAIPTELVDSELFGHERGSFTGAVGVHRGWFERADGGTLFLDEIGELPLAAQVRLLRVLQDGLLVRVGAQKPVRVDVRVVAATHRDLAAMVQDGRFREDLWYRLAVFPIHLPPLRQRKQDLPALAAYFASRAGRRLGGRALIPSAEDIRLLEAQPWPGNVRELGAVIERAAIMGGGQLDLVGALGDALSPSPAGPRPAALSTLAEAVRTHLRRALEHCQGRIEGETGAAKLLDLPPATLRSKLKKHKLDPSDFR